MFRKILCPTDFSDCAAKALEYAKRLREAGTESVIVIHVIDTRTIMLTNTAWVGLTPAEYEEQLQRQVKKDAEKKLEGIKEEIENVGLRPSVRVLAGIPFSEIIKTAEDEDVSLIVLGSHGRSNVKEMLLGSVSEKVVRKSKRPVLVVRRDTGSS